MSENSSEEPEDLDKEITDNEQSNGILYCSKLRVNLTTSLKFMKSNTYKQIFEIHLEA